MADWTERFEGLEVAYNRRVIVITNKNRVIAFYSYQTGRQTRWWLDGRELGRAKAGLAEDDLDELKDIDSLELLKDKDSPTAY